MPRFFIESGEAAIRRRSFLVSPALGFAAPAISKRPIPAVAQWQVMGAGAMLATSNNPLNILITQQAAIATAAARTNYEAQTLARGFAVLTQRIKAAPTLAETKQILVGDFARSTGVSRAIDDALRQGRLGAGAVAFFEKTVGASGTSQSLLGVATRRIGQTLGETTSPVAVAAYQAVGSVLGLTSVSTPKDLVAVLSPALGGAAEDLQQLLAGRGALERRVQTYSEQLRKRVQVELKTMAAPLAAYPKQLLQFRAVAKDLPSSAQWKSGAESLRAGAGALYSALSLFGASEEANAVANVAGYAESAVQVLQAVSLLASVTTGWGAVSALSGLIGGAGGLGAFGGGSSSGASELAHQQIMAAISDLRTEIVRQFSQVNAKLDFVITQLDAVLSVIRRVDLTTQEILARVKVVEAQVNLVLLRQGESGFVGARLQMQRDSRECRSQRRNPAVDLATLVRCRSHDASAADLATKQPLQLPASGDSVARTVLMTRFPTRPADVKDDAVETWQAGAALTRVLSSYQLNVPQGAAHQDVLLDAVDGYTNWRLSWRALFDSTDLQDRQDEVRDIRAAMHDHQAFLAFLRDESVYRRIQQKFATEANKLFRELTQEQQKALRAELDRLGKGDPNPGFKYAAGATLTSKSATQAPSIPVFTAADFSEKGLSPYYNAHISPTDAGPVPPALSLIATRLVRSDIQQPGVVRFWVDERPAIEVEIYLHGELLSTEVVDLPKMTFSYRRDADGEARYVALTDPLRYLFLTDDQDTVSQRLNTAISAVLRKQELVREAFFLQWRRLNQNEDNAHRVYRQWLSRSPALGSNDPAGPKLSALGELDTLLYLLRALFKFAYDDVGEENDIIQSCLYGGMTMRLVDTEVLRDWVWRSAPMRHSKAETGEPDGNPRFVQLDELILFRWEVFSDAWQRLDRAAKQAGPSFRFARAMQEFNAVFPLKEYPLG